MLLFSFGSVPCGSARLHWNQTERAEPNRPFSSAEPKSTDSGFNGSSVKVGSFVSLFDLFHLESCNLALVQTGQKLSKGPMTDP